MHPARDVGDWRTLPRGRPVRSVHRRRSRFGDGRGRRDPALVHGRSDGDVEEDGVGDQADPPEPVALHAARAELQVREDAHRHDREGGDGQRGSESAREKTAGDHGGRMRRESATSPEEFGKKFERSRLPA
jgi:hypothetical protein